MRVAAFASGTGTNLQALIDSQTRGELAPAQLHLVIVNKPGAQAIVRAKEAKIPCVLIEHGHYATRKEFETALLETLDEHKIDLVVLAGFMRILSPHFVEAMPLRILNTHPALCPAFPGVNAAQQAIDAGVKVSGCTVHFVDNGVDTGPIVFQEAVAVRDDDDAKSLQRRIQCIEHSLLPQATRLLAAGRLRCEGRRVLLD